jgi:hypothetical protein
VCDSWLHKAVCRQRPELCVTVGYIKLCVDRDLNSGCSDSLVQLHISAC